MKNCAVCGNECDGALCPSCASDETDQDRCTNPGGHVWNRTAAEADELNLQGINAGIRCVYCGADGDA